MKLSSEVLQSIQQMASYLMTPDEIAILIEVELTDFVNELKFPDSEVYKAFFRGYLTRKVELKKTMLDPADVDAEEFKLSQLKEFESKLTIYLNA